MSSQFIDIVKTIVEKISGKADSQVIAKVILEAVEIRRPDQRHCNLGLPVDISRENKQRQGGVAI